MKKQVFSSLLICALVSSALAQENLATEGQPIILRAARILDVATGKILSPGVVVINGTKIASIDPRELPADADTVDLGDVTLLPGRQNLTGGRRFADRRGATLRRRRSRSRTPNSSRQKRRLYS